MTVPLLGMVGELLRRQEEMARLLANKDKEIDDYKSQGGRVSRSEWTIAFLYVNSLTPGRCDSNFRSMIVQTLVMYNM